MASLLSLFLSHMNSLKILRVETRNLEVSESLYLFSFKEFNPWKIKI